MKTTRKGTKGYSYFIVLLILFSIGLTGCDIENLEQYFILEETQSIPTHSAGFSEFYTINGNSYLAMPNNHNDVTYSIDSVIYKWDNGEFKEEQVIPTNGGYDFEQFSIEGEEYLFCVNWRTDLSFNVNSVLYKWTGTNFTSYQDIPTIGASSATFFTIGDGCYLAVAFLQDVMIVGEQIVPQFHLNSKIYKWNYISKQFEDFQEIPTVGGFNWEHFMIDGEHYLAIANSIDLPPAWWNIDSKIYKWDGDSFEEFQTISGNGIIDFEHFEIDGVNYLAIANFFNNLTTEINSKILIWNGSSFEEFQNIPTKGASDFEYFERKEGHFLAVCNNTVADTGQIQQSTGDFNQKSIIYKWNDENFEEYLDVDTIGAVKWTYFTINDTNYLALSNNRDASSKNQDSKIYKLVSFEE
ncbi:MAG: hypothetical protein JXB88_00015 [Spirochaetales bacterium]|nr:hypothetical protein [Spirochaetales bacterium]